MLSLSQTQAKRSHNFVRSLFVLTQEVSNTTSVGKDVEPNQMCGHVMLLPSYFFSHYVLLIQVCVNLTKWNKVAVLCDKSVQGRLRRSGCPGHGRTTFGPNIVGVVLNSRSIALQCHVQLQLFGSRSLSRSLALLLCNTLPLRIY